MNKGILLRNALLIAAVTLFSCKREPEYDAWAAGETSEINVLEQAGKKEYVQAEPIVRGSHLRIQTGKSVTIDGVKYLQASSGSRKIMVPEASTASSPAETGR